MLLLWAVPIGVLVGYLRGGRLAGLNHIQLRAPWLILIAFTLQILIFPLPGLDGAILEQGTVPMHLASYAALIAFVGVNWREWGIVVMGLGMLANVVIITANGGYMPTTLEDLRAAGLDGAAEALGQCADQGDAPCTYANNMLAGDDTVLWWLGDIFATPDWIPLANVFSVGDALLGVGLVAYLQAKMAMGKRGD